MFNKRNIHSEIRTKVSNSRMFAVPQEVKVISVTKLNRFAKQVLESEIGQVWVSGEISNFTNAASGHWYFTLKDDKAQVRTAMFRGANKSVGFTPKHGDKVVVKANISLYEARGDYQLIAVAMEPEGVGKLKQAFEALKAKLLSEGLFTHENKQALPKHITKIGIVTSQTGAAVHDILHVLQRRNPSIEVIIYPSMVQGDSAAATIVAQIECANARNEVDVLVVGRGGGSLEDLWPFNEEIVARAIHASTLVVVSAVGHEVDVTIADFVADVRAATPSAAAELLSEDKQVLEKNLNERKRMLMRALNDILAQKHLQTMSLQQRLQAQHPIKKLNQNSQQFDYLHARLLQQHPSKQIKIKLESLQYLHQRLQAQHPKLLLRENNLALSRLQQRLAQAIAKQLDKAKQHHANQAKSMQYVSPINDIKRAKQNSQTRLQELCNAMKSQVANKGQHLSKTSALLDTVSPLATLSRGYSITLSENNLLTSVKDIQTNQIITSKFADGEIESTVNTIKNTSPNSSSS
ncbi:MAG: exodeoxyribonuclease VII large subunit [Alphaproteobacteria bacterium]|jgi:exodeoxyribonuclease VII large subunit